MYRAWRGAVFARRGLACGQMIQVIMMFIIEERLAATKVWNRENEAICAKERTSSPVCIQLGQIATPRAKLLASSD